MNFHVQPTSFADRLSVLFAACRKHARVSDYFRGVDICDVCMSLASECEVLLAVEALEEPVDRV